MRGSVRRLLAAGLLPVTLLNACYTYQAVTGPTPGVGAEIRVNLSPPQNFQLGEFTIHDVNRVEGEVYHANADSLLVWGSWLHTRIGSKYRAERAMLFVPRSRIALLEQQRIAPAQTGLLAAAGAAVVFLLVKLVERVAGGGDSDGGKPPPPVDP